MARVGRKPEKVIKLWGILRRNTVGGAIGQSRVDSPLDLLQANGISRQYAGLLLTKLEEAGYIRKQFMGGVRLEYVILLRDVDELGEDILGTEEPVFSTQATVPASRPTQEPVSSVQAQPIVQMPPQVSAIATPTYSPVAARNDVVLVIDYDNINIPLTSIGAEFPAEKLFRFARGKGNVISALAFVPLTAPRDARLFLRRSGYRIVECPPLKDGGGDTVDKTIEEFMRMLMSIPSVGTFILASRDADFQDAKRMVQDYGKQCISVYYDPAFNDVRSEDGESIYVALGHQAAGYGNGNGNGAPYTGSREANKFFSIISGIELGKISFDSSNKHHEFIVRTIEFLLTRSKELEQFHTRKNFTALCNSLWAEIGREFRDYSRENMRELLTAFNNRLVLRQNKYGEQTYYTFDNQCPLVNRLTSLRVLRGT